MDVYRKKLSCGANFVGLPYEDGKNTLALGIGINRGATHDPARPLDLRGAHHFLEHLLFKSNQNSDRVKLGREIEFQAGSTNASTDYLLTMVYCTLGVSHLPLAMDYLTHLAGRRPVFKPHELGLERKVVLEERSMYHDAPSFSLVDMAQEQLYLPPFGGSVLGTEESLAEITSRDIIELWEQGYKPKEFTLGAVGDVDFSSIACQFDAALVKKSPNGEGNLSLQDFPIILKSPSRNIEIREGLEQCHLGFAIPAPLPSSPDFEAFALLNAYLTHGMFTARLFQDLREAKGLVYGMDGSYNTGKGYGFYVVSLGTNPENAPEVIEIVRRGFESAQSLGPQEFELYRGKSVQEIEQLHVNKEDMLVQLFEYEHDGSGVERYLKRKENMQGVTLEQFHRVANIRDFSIAAISPKRLKGFD